MPPPAGKVDKTPRKSFFCLAFTMLTGFMQAKTCIKCQGSPCTVSVKAMRANTACDLCHIMHRRCEDVEEKTGDEDFPNQGEVEQSARAAPPAPMTQRGRGRATSVTRTRRSATPSRVPETVVDLPEPSGSRRARSRSRSRSRAPSETPRGRSTTSTKPRTRAPSTSGQPPSKKARTGSESVAQTFSKSRCFLLCNTLI